MATLTASRTTLAAFAGLSLVGALAGCSADGASSPIVAGPLADGTYTATGSYQAPSGTESVEVTVTLKDDIITEVSVVGDATDPQAQQHQGEFVDGIAGVVVGKDISSLQVDKVGGSSLTSGGFNKAIEEIKAEAAA